MNKQTSYIAIALFLAAVQISTAEISSRASSSQGSSPVAAGIPSPDSGLASVIILD